MLITLTLVLTGIISIHSAALSKELEPPVRLEAAGKPIP